MTRLLTGLFCALTCLYAQAWDGVVSGKIIGVEAVGGASTGQNFDLRVTLSSSTPPCPGSGVNWSYMNAGDYNYKGVMSVLLMAQAMGKDVTMYTLATGGGFCQIGWVIVK